MHSIIRISLYSNIPGVEELKRRNISSNKIFRRLDVQLHKQLRSEDKNTFFSYTVFLCFKCVPGCLHYKPVSSPRAGPEAPNSVAEARTACRVRSRTGRNEKCPTRTSALRIMHASTHRVKNDKHDVL